VIVTVGTTWSKVRMRNHRRASSSGERKTLREWPRCKWLCRTCRRRGEALQASALFTAFLDEAQ